MAPATAILRSTCCGICARRLASPRYRGYCCSTSLYREGDTAGYQAASTECRRHVNVNLNGYPVSQDSKSSHGLEDYPHPLEQLVVVWGSPIIEDFFDVLIYDKYGGTRIGFDPGAYRGIPMLRAISRDILPLAV